MSEPNVLEPTDLLTPDELASRLKVSKNWISEQTRARGQTRRGKPLPFVRCGKFLRFIWPDVVQWLQDRGV
jgi:hypothetical protein